MLTMEPQSENSELLQAAFDLADRAQQEAERQKQIQAQIQADKDAKNGRGVLFEFVLFLP